MFSPSLDYFVRSRQHIRGNRFGLSVWCVRGDETLARLPLRAQDGCEGASFMACAHIEGGEVHSPSVAAIAGAFYASISLFEQDPSRIGFSFEPRL